jgi:micrococcal nuclease
MCKKETPIFLIIFFFILTSCAGNPVIPQTNNPNNRQHTTLISTPMIPSEYSCIPRNNKREIAVVEKVIDGDSILVSMNGALFEVRYVGINTPEFDSPQEKEAEIAMEKNRDLVLGKTIWMVRDVRDKDKYQRLLRFVFVGNTFVNLALVQQGVAEVHNYPPDTSCQSFFWKNIPES